MANQLEKGHTFVDGNTVNAATLNALVDSATALGGIISEQGAAIAPNVAGDRVLFLRGTTLHTANVSALPDGVTSVDFDATPGTVFNDSVSDPTGDAVITLSLANQGPGKVLAGPVSGAAAEPAFRVLSPSDTSNFVSIAADLIDLTLSNAFYKHLTTTPFTLKFTAGTGTAGQVFKVRVRQKSSAPVAVLHWSSPGGSILWPGGTEPVLTATLDAFDIFEFLCAGTDDYYGIRWGANFS